MNNVQFIKFLHYEKPKFHQTYENGGIVRYSSLPVENWVDAPSLLSPPGSTPFHKRFSTMSSSKQDIPQLGLPYTQILKKHAVIEKFQNFFFLMSLIGYLEL